MTIKDNGDLVLSSGRVLSPIACVIGLGYDDDPNNLRTFHTGYDDTEYLMEPIGVSPDPEDEWTNEERVELADFMIAKWTQWRNWRK